MKCSVESRSTADYAHLSYCQKSKLLLFMYHGVFCVYSEYGHDN